MCVYRFNRSCIHHIRIFTVRDDWLECGAGIIDVEIFNLRSGISIRACAHEKRHQKETD